MSSEIPQFVPGWISDPQRVRDSIMDRASKGEAVLGATYCSQYANELPGTWARMKARGIRGIFLRDSEVKILGHYRRPWFQKRGTCVSRGTGKGAQTSLDVAIANNIELLKPVEVTFAPIYSLARVEVGRNKCGSGDGAILADAMRAIHDYGVATSELFRGLSEDEVEQLACKFASPGQATPSTWQLACKGHTCITFWPESLELLMDCIAAGYAAPYAHSYITGMPNKSGISDLGSYGPHCRCFTGVFVDENGEDQLESAESWGRFPAGQPAANDQTIPIDQMPRITLRYAGGEKLLAPGNVGVKARRFWDQINNGGEAWAVSAPLFQASGVSDLIQKQVA